jgi:hypothetical protein
MSTISRSRNKGTHAYKIRPVLTHRGAMLAAVGPLWGDDKRFVGNASAMLASI